MKGFFPLILEFFLGPKMDRCTKPNCHNERHPDCQHRMCGNCCYTYCGCIQNGKSQEGDPELKKLRKMAGL